MPAAACKIMRVRTILSVTVVSAVCGGALIGCSSSKGPDVVTVRDDYLLKSKFVTPLNNGISRSQTVRQPVLAEMGEGTPDRFARPVEGNILRWDVYEKPYPVPSYTEGIAGAGMNDGIVASVYFPRNKADGEDYAPLKDLAEKLKSIAGPLTVVGYTDINERKRNPGLGLERAKFVAAKLEELGVPSDRIKVKNGGATRVYYGPEKDRCVNIILRVK